MARPAPAPSAKPPSVSAKPAPAPAAQQPRAQGGAKPAPAPSAKQPGVSGGAKPTPAPSAKQPGVSGGAKPAAAPSAQQPAAPPPGLPPDDYWAWQYGGPAAQAWIKEKQRDASAQAQAPQSGQSLSIPSLGGSSILQPGNGASLPGAILIPSDWLTDPLQILLPGQPPTVLRADPAPPSLWTSQPSGLLVPNSSSLGLVRTGGVTAPAVMMPGIRCDLDGYCSVYNTGYWKNLIIEAIEDRYAVDIQGPWRVYELELLYQSLNKADTYARGTENLNDVLVDGARTWVPDAEKLIALRLSGSSAQTGNYHAAWCQDSRGRGCIPGAIVFSDDVFTSDYQLRRVGLHRPAELGLNNVNSGIQITMLHEIIHVFVDARPESIQNWRLVYPLMGKDREEDMANAFAIYFVSGGQYWPEYPQWSGYVSGVHYLWQATP